MWAEWSYNTSCHSGTNLSSFEVTFGKKPPNIPQYITSTSNFEAVDDLLIRRESVFASLCKKLLKAQIHMKKVADGHKKDKEFQIGDWVMVKLRPHRQASATSQSHSKLSKRFYRPFQVEDRIGRVAYKLQLLEHSRIHPMFHCSILIPFHPSSSMIPKPVALPTSAMDNQLEICPLAFLETRWDSTPSGPKQQVLVQWVGLALEDTSWEDWSDLRATYHLENKVLPDAHGNVMAKAKEMQVEENGPEEITNDKPKRKHCPPSYLKDYE